MVNVFSFCLYGPQNPKYYDGMLENIVVIRRHFPDWKIYIYTGADVPDNFIQILKTCPEVVVFPTGTEGGENMVHRFFAIDRPEVDIMMVRDADSRVHYRDRFAIRDFLKKPQYTFHTIRDNPVHCAKLMGGLWGMRKTNVNIQKEFEDFSKNAVDYGYGYGLDQDFLTEKIYKRFKNSLLVHVYSMRVVFKDENSLLIPLKWTNDCYCGKVEIPKQFIDRVDPQVPLFSNFVVYR